MRILKPAFVEDLKIGILSPVLDAVHTDGSLDFQIRDNQVHIYYRGGKILDLRPKRGGGYHSSFDLKYMDNWTKRPEDISDPILKPEQPDAIESQKDSDAWVTSLPQLKRIMDRWFVDHPKKEREHQQLVVDQNNKLPESDVSDFWVLDIEYAKNVAAPDNPGHSKAARFDLIAMITAPGAPPRLGFIEMKYEDKALRPPAGIRSHLQDFRSFLADSENSEIVKQEMFEVLKQKIELRVLRGDCGLELPSETVAFSNEKPLFIFLFAEHNRKSSVLRDELSKTDDPIWCELKFAFADAGKYLMDYSSLYDLTAARSLA